MGSGVAPALKSSKNQKTNERFRKSSLSQSAQRRGDYNKFLQAPFNLNNKDQIDYDFVNIDKVWEKVE